MTATIHQFPGEQQEVREPTNDSSVTGVPQATPFRWRDPVTIPRRAFLYGNHAIRKFVSVTAAAGGTGKTALVVTEALAFVSGRDLLDDHLRASGKAWYIGLEDPLDEYQRRFVAAAIFYKIDPHVIASGLFLDSGRTQNFVIASEGPEGTQIAKPIVGAIIDNILRNNISLVVVDPFIDSHDVNENNNGAINAVAREWAYIAEETGAAVEVIHHLRKGTAGQEPTADDVRGARALIDKSRSTRLLIPMTAKEAKDSGADNRRRFFRVIGAKVNLALPPEAGIWRQLVSIPLSNGRDGDPGDCVQVATRQRPSSSQALEAISPVALDAIKARIAEGEWRADPQAMKWAGRAVAEVHCRKCGFSSLGKA